MRSRCKKLLLHYQFIKLLIGVAFEIRKRAARFIFITCSRSLMDKTLVCGTETPGSIPGGSTRTNENLSRLV